MKLTGIFFTFTVSGNTFTVSDETYRCCPVCTYVSFITDCKSFATDCKSENSTCKFCQLLQLVTIARTAIRLTATRGEVIEIDFVCPGGGHTKSIFLFSFTPLPPGRTKRGTNENVSPVSTALHTLSYVIIQSVIWYSDATSVQSTGKIIKSFKCCSDKISPPSLLTSILDLGITKFVICIFNTYSSETFTSLLCQRASSFHENKVIILGTYGNI